METLIRDLRYAVRMLVKRPAWTLAAVLCLGLGIGGATVVFSLVDGILLRPLGYEEPERLEMIWPGFTGRDQPRVQNNALEFIAYKEQLTSFESIAEMILWTFSITDGDRAEQILTGRVSASLFPLLGVTPALGRTWTEEEQEERASIIVISHGLWQRRYGSDPDLVGKTLDMNGRPREIIGVMPQGFYHLIPDVEMWIPLRPNPSSPKTVRLRTVVGRLAPGVSREQAAAELDVLARTLQEGDAELYPEGSGWTINLRPLHDQITENIRPHLLALFAAVGLVLLIACANVANLILARATTREREVAVRSALGAKRRTLARQLLTESLLLAVLGAVLGIVLAALGVRGLALLDLGHLPRLDEVTLDLRVLGFALAASLLTGAIFGLAPILRAFRLDLFATLKEGGHSPGESGKLSLRNVLVVAEIALALVALVAAGLMIRSVKHLQGIDPGIRTQGGITLQMGLPNSQYPTPENRIAFYNALLQGLETKPGIESFGIASRIPMEQAEFQREISVPGWQGNANPVVSSQVVSPGYFDAMGISLVPGNGGRFFTDQDRGDTQPVAIVDTTLAEHLWGDENPIGKRLSLVSQAYGMEREVVGLVESVRHNGPQYEPTFQFYVPFLQLPFPSISLAIETRADPASVAAAVREVVRGIDPTLPVGNVRTTEETISESISRPRLNRILFGLFGGVALVLTAVGVYSVTAYSVNLRSAEIGLRMALGARHGDVVKLILRRGLGLALVGLAVGLVLAFVLIRAGTTIVEELVYGVEATDPVTLVAVCALLALLATAACFFPARRASKIDPMSTLRQE